MAGSPSSWSWWRSSPATTGINIEVATPFDPETAIAPSDAVALAASRVGLLPGTAAAPSTVNRNWASGVTWATVAKETMAVQS